MALPFGYDPVISLAISRSYADDHTLYIGCEAQGLRISADEGEHWKHMAEKKLSDPVNSIIAAGTDLLAANGGALWHSADGRLNWTNRLPEGYEGLELSAVLAPTGCWIGVCTARRVRGRQH